MPTLNDLLQGATRRLEPVTETPRLDAEILLAHALGLTRAQLLARLRGEAPAAPQFEALLARRLNHEPIAYILGAWEFYSLEFNVRPPILVPRPETEHLVEAALGHLAKPPAANHQPPTTLDLCTGTGCVAIAIAKNAPGIEVHATDLNPAAIAIARENAAKHGIDVSLHQGDLFDALPPDAPRFDVIVSNPPYVEDNAWDTLPPVIRKHEDPRALLAGPGGLDVIRRIIAQAPNWLRPRGLLALEIGETHYPAVAELLREHGFANVHPRHDLAGIPRIACATR